ncbi:DNA repair protein RecN [Candidatus Formimonas warabiya]|uniref:DNA repair protein RecN n=1 Tax=Formimonas warabiya TaxID=1761012 RepID=A0A3G1KNJ8_FORW1|nr:DNA repair protein RecN [Candidatus Formimonas warabiya]ATW24061.1 DNA repair protein RecN [Candidatus Formimonas warabiya]
MLEELYVENFGLIEKINVTLSPGFNVITGETGAGKSLIIDAVGLLMGGRGSQDFIRTGTDKLMIQGMFHGEFSPEAVHALQEAGLDLEENTLILNREFSRNGKNICRINFRVVPLSLYKEIGKKLINIHGQHEHMNLMEEENQLTLLDNYGGIELLTLKNQVRDSFLRLKKIQNQMEGLKEKNRDAAQKADFLRFQIKEVEDAHLEIHEDEDMEKERILLHNAEKLVNDSRLAYTKLYGSRQSGACDLIREAVQLLKDLSPLDDKMMPIFQSMNEVYFALEDMTRELSNYCESVISDPLRLNEIEQRLTFINKLKKKYGSTISEIKEFAHEAMKELADLESQEQNAQDLEASLEQEKQKFSGLSGDLSALRKSTGEKLSSAITHELHQLQMPFAKFFVAVEESTWHVNGKDRGQFLISPNPGEELKPVMRIASGGEMSRIMLGIKVILAQLDEIPTLIFDEIDSGLGGKVVYAVGEKMQKISAYAQVICVTHSPVIASFADTHLHIVKEMTAGRTVTKINKLDDEQIVEELGRMVAGDNVSEATIIQVKELLKIGHEKKND